jgi:small subunit ribosomal protein S14|tara:strand:- start:134 stop:436 length:303 start_codon:yes stop_codon:yes gene_type:complete
VARKAIVEREAGKAALVEKYRDERIALKKTIKSSTDMEAVRAAQEALHKLPLNSSPSRLSTRCQQCGRQHAVYRKFGLCRICLRENLMVGNVTGGRKSSW